MCIRDRISSVSNDVSGVKTDVGGVKTDLTATKTQLQTDEAAMTAMKGDMGLQSGLIATNGKELDVLKHMGDRNYYEFTLDRNQKKAVATVAPVSYTHLSNGEEGAEQRKSCRVHNSLPYGQ